MTVANLKRKPTEVDDKRENLENGAPSEEPVEYRLYKSRWLILLLSVGSEVLLSFRTWRFTIPNIVYPHWNTTVEEVTAWSVLPIIVNTITLIPFGRALDQFGVRFMAYTAGPVLVLSNVLQSIILMDETNSYISIPKDYRFPTFIVCNLLLIFNMSATAGLTAKLANDWFHPSESTFVLVFPNVIGRLIETTVAILTPVFVRNEDELKFIGYTNLGLVAIYFIIILTCVSRSHPPTPPSANAQKALEIELPPLSTFLKVLMNTNLLIAIVASSVNVMTPIILNGVFADALSKSGYSDSFSGLVSASTSLSFCSGGLLATWLDRKYNYITVTRVCSITMAVSFTIVHVCQLHPNLRFVIITANIILGISRGILLPLVLQALLRSSRGVLTHASMVALVTLVSVINYTLLTIALIALKSKSSTSNPYINPYAFYCILILISNYTYAFAFRISSKRDCPGGDESININ